ncbi:MAG: hypothetical protein K1X74_18620 [Pirellulales bacterium]|nr:hypothetical protein [Pirellulales bacterium]
MFDSTYRGSGRRRLTAGLAVVMLSWLAQASAEYPAGRGDRMGTDRLDARQRDSQRALERSEAPLTREGSQVDDIRGNFRHVGERLVFQPQDEIRPLVILENLNAERVTKTLQEAGKSSLPWSVSGTVTEFRGDNYLLLSRAVLKSGPAGSARAAR